MVPMKGHDDVILKKDSITRNDGGCFHGSNMVRLESGKQKLISDVEVGESYHSNLESCIFQFPCTDRYKLLRLSLHKSYRDFSILIPLHKSSCTHAMPPICSIYNRLKLQIQNLKVYNFIQYSRICILNTKATYRSNCL